MSSSTSNNKIFSFFFKRIVYHAVAWLVLFAFLVFLDKQSASLGKIIAKESINILFYMIIVYYNLQYLIPKYLAKNHFFKWLGILVLLAILLTPIKTFVLYVLFSDSPQKQLDIAHSQHYQFLFMFLVAGVSTVGKIFNDWLRTTREMQELATKTMQSELKFLKTQINPHFLFNTLNNIYALSLKKSDKTPETVIKLSEMMRYMLYECNEKRVLLANEIKYIKNYIDLESLRQAKNVEIIFEIEGEVSSQKIAPLIFTPFLENAFKHGISNHLTKGYIKIKLHVEAFSIVFTMENSKPDLFLQQKSTRNGGIGLKNLRRRLELIYPNNYNLTIKDQPNSYLVELSLDLD